MAKKNYSGAVQSSLEGRAPATPTEERNQKEEMTTAAVQSTVAISKPAVKTAAKKNTNNAGRKKIDDSKKKKQMVLTLTPDTYNRLIEWAESKSRTAPNYVSEFVEEHIDEIIK